MSAQPPDWLLLTKRSTMALVLKTLFTWLNFMIIGHTVLTPRNLPTLLPFTFQCLHHHMSTFLLQHYRIS